jgi:hypothetical protein
MYEDQHNINIRVLLPYNVHMGRAGIFYEKGEATKFALKLKFELVKNNLTCPPWGNSR